MKTVHLIFNAHLDPVWLWRWSAGLDEIINTCTSVCDILDRHPTLKFTRGEAWVYQQLEKLCPPLFKRVCSHIESGQWEVVGGWFIQPDCNFPSLAGFEKQIDLGMQYFERTFRLHPKIGYNVDSFGHAATLPDIMNRFGQSGYVMMRPQEHEMDLPARLFRWRGLSGGEVTAFRISEAYCTSRSLEESHILASLKNLPAGIDHTMCFVGVGDHGGGPTEDLVQWCYQHMDAFDDIKLEFSTVSRFFEAIHSQISTLPIVQEELQHHAIGCYSVLRDVKELYRKAEWLLGQANSICDSVGPISKEYGHDLKTAWEWTCFNAFHDTLGGTSLPSSNEQATWQLGRACCTASEILTSHMRQEMFKMPADPAQRIVVGNFTHMHINDFVEHEPWLEWTGWKVEWGLMDESGERIPYQVIAPEAVRDDMFRLIFKVDIPPGEFRTLRIVGDDYALGGRVKEEPLGKWIGGQFHIGNSGGTVVDLPCLVLRCDETDTWSHGVDGFHGEVAARVQWDEPSILESGVIYEAWEISGCIGDSPVRAEYRFFRESMLVELRLEIDWREKAKVLQLIETIPSGNGPIESGVAGGHVCRNRDKKEYPFHDYVRVKYGTDNIRAIACPDVHSYSATKTTVRLTLLRSCFQAHHDPHVGPAVRRKLCDRGEHSFAFRYLPSGDTSINSLEHAAACLRGAFLSGDLTVGMPVRCLRGAFTPGK